MAVERDEALSFTQGEPPSMAVEVDRALSLKAEPGVYEFRGGDAGMTAPLLAQLRSEARVASERVQQDLNTLYRAIEASEVARLGIGGNNPPESLSEVIKRFDFRGSCGAR